MPSPHSYAVPKMRLYEMFAQKSGGGPSSPSFDNTAATGLMQTQAPSPSAHVLPPPPMGEFLNPPPSSTSTNDLIMAKLEQMLVELDRLIQHSGIITFSLLPPNHDICLVMRQMPLLISQSLNPEQTMLTFMEKIVYMLYKSTSTLALEAYTLFLQSLFDMSPEAGKEALLWLVYADDQRKYNASVISMLIRHQLMPLEEFDNQLAKHIKLQPDAIVIDFAVELIRICLLSSTPFTNMEDHIMTITALMQRSDEKVTSLVDDLRQRVCDVYPMIKLEDVDYLSLRLILAEWNRLCQHPACHRPLLDNLATRLLEATKHDDGQCFFLRMALETCVQHYIQGKPRAIHWVDALARLVAHLVSLTPDASKQVALIGHTLSVVVLVLAQYHETLGLRFNQKPFFRLLSLLLLEICKLPNAHIDDGILTCYCDTLFALQPLHFPGFAVSWLQLISHRVLLPQLLAKNDRRGWAMYHKLVLCLLRFLSPLLDKQVLQTSTKAFYRGTLRYLVVLLHDFPEFLCEYYMVFVQVIPHACIQLRNMVLSAFPLVMHFPDPLTPDLRLDLLPECMEAPSLVQSFTDALPASFLIKLALYAQGAPTPTPASLEDDALALLVDDDQEIREDVLNALVLSAAMPVIKTQLASNPALALYRALITRLPGKGSYLVLSAMADHLRYPNSHTHFFSQAMLTLFRDMPEPVKEQITRILLERLIVNRPHPWGLLATFIALIKEPDFWNHSFVRSSPEIERLFENVGRSIKRLA
ncbi:CCR4-Not complex component, Not1-domain-containing protein [Gongronella butleri]|nr:CCR4-Not complex component, Not1-domain-containing protein [Gongronella butleri]